MGEVIPFPKAPRPEESRPTTPLQQAENSLRRMMATLPGVREIDPAKRRAPPNRAELLAQVRRELPGNSEAQVRVYTDLLERMQTILAEAVPRCP